MPLVSSILHTLGHAAAERARDASRAAARHERKLRIGVDIRPLYEPLTGIGWYLHSLLHEFARHDDVALFLLGDARVTDRGPELHAAVPENAQLLTFDLRGRGEISRAARAATAAAYVAWLELLQCDVIFGANYFLPRLHSAAARRRVITVHDLTYKRHPELLQKETLANLERHMQREIAIADAVICVSESTRRDLLAYYEADPSRVITIHSGFGATAPYAEVDGLPRRYILFVSTIEPRKNLGVLLDAFDAIRGSYDGDLVVVGRIGWKSDAMVTRLRGPRIHHLDYVDASRLATIYRNAEAFVMPSLYEGFGFPLLEAMAHGVPAIAARSSSLPEVGGDAALYFDPHDPRGLAAHLGAVTEDARLRASLIEKGHAQVARFRWERAANETLDVLRRVASGG
jgi:glycosyltransferase involved in cell wall biosynthesis